MNRTLKRVGSYHMKVQNKGEQPPKERDQLASGQATQLLCVLASLASIKMKRVSWSQSPRFRWTNCFVLSFMASIKMKRVSWSWPDLCQLLLAIFIDTCYELFYSISLSPCIQKERTFSIIHSYLTLFRRFSHQSKTSHDRKCLMKQNDKIDK